MWAFFIVGLIAGGVTAVVLWLRNQNIEVRWYEWLIGGFGLLLLLFTIQNFFGSFAEREPNVAWMLLLVIGLPAVILLAVAWQLIARRQRAS